MGQNFLQRLFGIGAVPQQARAVLEPEGIVFLEEGVHGSVTFRNFRAPGKYSWRRRSGFSGSIVLTEQRFAVFNYSKSIVDVAYDHPLFRELHLSLKDEKTLVVRFEAAAFNAKQSGEIECRFSTSEARNVLEQLRRRAG